MLLVERVPVASRPIAAIRTTALASELSTLVPAELGRVYHALRQAGAKFGRGVAIYDGAPERVELIVGVELESPFADTDEVIVTRTPAGEAACATLLGDYGRLGEVHRQIVDWCRANGLERTGLNWEIYGHWPQDGSPPRTDVFHLLA